jgi:prevent-host-death family protein
VKNRITASEFQQACDAVCAKALREPVTITKYGRPQLVIMAAEEFERLKRQDRKVGLVEDLPDEWIEAVRQAKVPDAAVRLRDDDAGGTLRAGWLDNYARLVS